MPPAESAAVNRCRTGRRPWRPIASHRRRDAGARPGQRTKRPLGPGAAGQDALGHRPRQPVCLRRGLRAGRPGAGQGRRRRDRRRCGDPARWPEADREPLEFALPDDDRGACGPDELFARLRQQFGDKQVAAMVLLAASAISRTGSCSGWHLSLEAGGPCHRSRSSSPRVRTSRRRSCRPDQGTRLLGSGTTVVERDPEWSKLTYDELQTRLERQRARTPRLPIPTCDEVKTNLPPAIAAARPTRIVWNLVCSGYVPELAIPGASGPARCGPRRKRTASSKRACSGSRPGASAATTAWATARCCWRSPGSTRRRRRAHPAAGGRRLVVLSSGRAARLCLRPQTDQTPWELNPADYKGLEQDFGPERRPWRLSGGSAADCT